MGLAPSRLRGCGSGAASGLLQIAGLNAREALSTFYESMWKQGGRLAAGRFFSQSGQTTRGTAAPGPSGAWSGPQVQLPAALGFPWVSPKSTHCETACAEMSTIGLGVKQAQARSEEEWLKK